MFLEAVQLFLPWRTGGSDETNNDRRLNESDDRLGWQAENVCCEFGWCEALGWGLRGGVCV